MWLPREHGGRIGPSTAEGPLEGTRGDKHRTCTSTQVIREDTGWGQVSRGRDREELKRKTGGVRSWDLGQSGCEVKEYGQSRLRVDIQSPQ